MGKSVILKQTDLVVPRFVTGRDKIRLESGSFDIRTARLTEYPDRVEARIFYPTLKYIVVPVTFNM